MAFDSTGNMTLTFGNTVIVGGIPSNDDVAAKGTWDASSNTFTAEDCGFAKNDAGRPLGCTWSIAYQVDAARSELGMTVTVHNGDAASKSGVSLWPVNGKRGSIQYPANLTGAPH